jgi:hypothetical protein
MPGLEGKGKPKEEHRVSGLSSSSSFGLASVGGVFHGREDEAAKQVESAELAFGGKGSSKGRTRHRSEQDRQDEHENGERGIPGLGEGLGHPYR